AGGRTLPVAGHRYRQRAPGRAGAARQRPARAVRHAVPETPPASTAVWAAGATAPLALSWSSSDTPSDDPRGIEHLPRRWAGRAPAEGHPPPFTSSRLCDASPRSGGGWPTDPTLAGPSEPTHDQPLPPCHPTGPPRDSQPPGCVAAGAALMTALMTRPTL